MNNPVLISFNTVPGKQRQKKEKMQWTTCDALQLVFLLCLQSNSKKKISRYEQHVRNFKEKKKYIKGQRAVSISIEGRKMNL